MFKTKTKKCEKKGKGLTEFRAISDERFKLESKTSLHMQIKAADYSFRLQLWSDQMVIDCS